MENDDEDKYVNVSDDDPHANLIMEVIKNDSLRRLERVKKHESENHILTAAKLISPMIEDSFSAGYNWCVDTIKMSAQHSQLANDLEINKAVMFLRQKDFGSAIDTLKAFERQEGTKIASTASTNLSFLYLLQGFIQLPFVPYEFIRNIISHQYSTLTANTFIHLGDAELAERYAELARNADSYNAAAFVNLANVWYGRGDVEKAR